MGTPTAPGSGLLLWITLSAMAGPAMPDAPTDEQNETECVILLHGLARSPASMKKMERALKEAGFETVNQGYESRHHKIEDLSAAAIPLALEACRHLDASQVHFVTHSLGGILLRYYLSINRIEHLGRVVMLAPPNHGSELIDSMGNLPGFKWINGPAGMQLGTGAGSFVHSLPPADFELGIIAGDRSVNLINSTMLPNPDDGKISVASARLEGMTDFLIVHHTHPFIMKARDVIAQTIKFLREGSFDHGQTDQNPRQAKSRPD